MSTTSSTDLADSLWVAFARGDWTTIEASYGPRVAYHGALELCGHTTSLP
jgi:hypothetical protein